MHIFLASAIAIGSIFHLPNAQLYSQQNRSSQTDTCIRAIPKPIVKKNIFPQTKFILQRNQENGLIIATGTETIDFNNGDRLTITNTGCEYFTLVFEFKTSQISSSKITDRRYLYTRSAWLMKQTLRGLNSPLDIKRGIIALEKYAIGKTPPQLDTEISYGNPEIRSVVRLERVERASDNNAAVKVIFYYGPL